MNEPSLYDIEFPATEANIEADVEADFGLSLGREAPLKPLYQGLYMVMPDWWRTAVFDPHHTNRPEILWIDECT